MRELKATGMVFPQELSWKESASAYYEMTKPGISLMVVLTTAAGFYLALPKNSFVYLNMDYAVLFLLTVIGTALVSAGSCTLNHVIEYKHDKTMKRTMFRPLPAGKLRIESATIFGIALALVGIMVLLSVNIITAGLALATLVLYLGVYTPMKRKSTLNTLVGGIPGALPPLGGYVTVTNSFDGIGIVLFLVLFLWQMPHFLALAWMYRKDYERGGFRMMTLNDESGLKVAKNTLVYTIMLMLVSLLLSVFDATGTVYFIGALVLGTAFSIAGFRFLLKRTNVNARTVLISSYFYLLAIISLMFIDKA
jgi:heme o synthase